MLDWLMKKGQVSRVYMCTKEVLWDVESSSRVRRATILALSSYLRCEMFGADGIPLSVLDRPLDYSRSDLMRFYEGIENIRNSNTYQLAQTSKSIRRFGMELPVFAVEQAKATGRGIEILMCTIGAGIAPDRREDVRRIWRYLRESYPHLSQAILNLREVEQITSKATGFLCEGLCLCVRRSQMW